MQNRGTFTTLMAAIKKKVQGQACIIVCDNAPSHDGGTMASAIEGGAEQSQFFRKMTEMEGMYLYMTLKNKSHACISRDQQNDRSLRRLCRTASKMRLARHALIVWSSDVMLDATGPMGEAVMKNLLIKWIEEWLTATSARTSSQAESMW